MTTHVLLCITVTVTSMHRYIGVYTCCEMEIQTVLLIVCMIKASALESSPCWYCNHSNPVDPVEPLKFVDAYVQKHIIPAGTLGILTCCSGNRSDTYTTWYKFDPGSGSWKIINADGTPSLRKTGKICDQGQTLLFDKADIIADNGTYTCNASNGRSSISRNFTVIVSWCDSDPKLKIVGQPEPVIQVKKGTSFQQTCEGNFGCLGAVAPNSSAYWYYVDAEGQIYKLPNASVNRYSVTDGISEDESMRSAVLRIESVTEGDAGIFACNLTKDLYTIGFRISLTVQDSQTVIEKFNPLIICLSVLTLILIAGGVCYRYYRYYLIYKWKVFKKSLPKRIKEFDVTLITSLEVSRDSEEFQTIQAMQQKLKDKNYSVCLPREGKSNMDQVNLVAKCSAVIFLLNPVQEEESVFLDMCFGACNTEAIKPIFILTENLQNLTQVFGKEYKKVYETFPDRYKVLHWPSKNRKIRLTETNFWSAIWSELPEPVSTREERETTLQPCEHHEFLEPDALLGHGSVVRV